MESKEIAIAWANLTYYVKPFLWSSKKTILNKLYGSVEFGTITALMGPSGAGKTTLLDCIFGKHRRSLDKESKIYWSAERKIRSCFVGQHERENLILCLTVKENLMYASKLKNSDINHPIDHELNVKNIMSELMIEDICDTRVDCCSGGQQKRLTIAQEVVKVVKPNLLCIDEPTTGLDSNVAEILMQCLVKLAKKHRIAVITSIHQPNYEIYMMFDQLYILGKRGNCLFSGPPDHIATHLAENDISVNEYQVPIEQLLKLGSIDAEEQHSQQLIDKTRKATKLSVLNECQNKTKLIAKCLERQSKSFKLIDVWYIMMRSMTQLYIRQWKLLSIQLTYYIFFALCACKMFNDDIGKPDACFDPDALANDTCIEELENDSLLFQNQNFLYFISILTMISHLCTSALAYCDEAKIFLYEHQNSWYSTGSYFWAKNIVEICPSITYGASYAFVIYYMSGQILEEERLLGYVVIITLGFLISEAIGHSIGIIFLNYPQIAIMAAMATSASMVMFSNYFIPVSELPVPLQYVSDYSFLKYVFNSALLLVYGLNRCSHREKSLILLKYKLNGEELSSNFYKLASFFIVTRILAFLCLYFKTEIRISLNLFLKMKSKHEDPNNSQDIIMMKNLKNEVVGDIDIESNDKHDKLYMGNVRRRMSINNLAKRLSIGNISRRLSISNVGRRMSLFTSKLNRRRNTIYICSDNFEVDLDSDTTDDKKLIIIAWTDLTLCIPKSLFSDQKVILNQINGFFEFGTINALMGPSGAGKTSLLNCINGLYNEYLTKDTTILLSKFKKIKTCFITQNQRDHILTGLTGKQAVTYASQLKNSTKKFDHKKNVEEIMEELLLSNTSDTNVENCSGGEQKRLVIAMELTSIIKPNLLCIDEPTSGLDSNAADVVIKLLKQISKNHNICVITSIHQPNNELLLLFDKLYVLSKGGYCSYSGRPQRLSRYLIDCGIQYTRGQLPIEVLLKLSCNQFDDEVLEMRERTKQNEKQLIAIRSQNETAVYPDGIQRHFKRFLVLDLWLLIKRGLTYNFQFYWKIYLFQFSVYILFGLMLRMLYNPNIGHPSGCVSFDDESDACAKTDTHLEKEERLINNLKFNFFAMICVVLFTMTATILSFAYDIKVFFNENRNGWYSTGIFYWSKTVVELIPMIITIFCFAYVVDIYESENSMFFKYAVVMTIGALEMQSISHVMGILTAHNTRLGVFTIIALFIFSLMFSNVLIPVKELHYSLQVLSNLSTVKLLIESVMILFYGLGRCADREFSFILYLLDIEDRDLYLNLQLLSLQFFLFRAIALVILILKVNPIVNSRKTQKKQQNLLKNLFTNVQGIFDGIFVF